MIPLLIPLLLSPTWSSNAIWNSASEHILYPNQHLNLDNTSTQFTGEGRAILPGDGRLILEGDAPRYRVLEPLFQNVSISVDAKRVSEEQDLDYAGFVIGARSQHYTDAACGANTYYGSITYEGFARFEKELFHGHGRNAFYPNFEPGTHQIRVFDRDSEVPRDKWIHLNFTITTTENDNAKLQLAVDGEQVLEYEDNGGWSVDPDDVKCDGYYPDNKLIQSPGFVFIRNDGLGRAEYRNLTIHERVK